MRARISPAAPRRPLLRLLSGVSQQPQGTALVVDRRDVGLVRGGGLGGGVGLGGALSLGRVLQILQRSLGLGRISYQIAEVPWLNRPLYK